MSINKEEVMHIANLACLNLSNDEIDKYTKDMQEILKFAEMINSVNTDGLDETIVANEKSNAFRKDEVIDFKNKELLLKNAPSVIDGMFNIPNVIN